MKPEEEKQLLLKALCEMLPHGVGIIPDGQITPYRVVDIDFDKECVVVMPKDRELAGVGWLGFEDFKLILRPLSSMTEEEKNAYDIFFNEDGLLDTSVDVYVDWLHSHHFDYRGLIPMGLALPAKDGMYN